MQNSADAYLGGGRGELASLGMIGRNSFRVQIQSLMSGGGRTVAIGGRRPAINDFGVTYGKHRTMQLQI
jgi:hypothetical protein